jgi:DNA-directed RNA polymerase subunit M/transcription elongation factor TFIIS
LKSDIRHTTNMRCIILQPKGTTRNAMLPEDLRTLPTPEAISTILRRVTKPDPVGTYKWNGQTIHVFGYKTGKGGTENKHILPTPYDKITLYSDTVLIATKGSQLVSFENIEYQKFLSDRSGSGCAENETVRNELIDSDSDAPEEDEDIEEEDDDVEEDVVDEEEEEPEHIDIAEEEEEPIRPVRKPLSAAALKRNNKKLPTWYTIKELSTIDYTSLPSTKYDNDLRTRVYSILQTQCGTIMSESELYDFERGIFNASLDDAKRRGVHRVWENQEFQNVYMINARRTIANIDPKSYIQNPRLLDRFRDGEFRPHEIAFMNYSDLYPEKWGPMIELAIKREAKMLEVDKSMATDMFKCSRCGKRQCTYYEMQTRSADEPMTQFIRCLNCGKQWRQ